MRLWIESAYQTLVDAGTEEFGDAIRTFTTEDQFIGMLVGGAMIGGDEARALATRTVDQLAQARALGDGIETLLASLPQGVHVPLTMIQVGPSSVAGRRSASLVECDAPPLFMARRGRLVLLPVIEEEAHGRLIRRCEFDLQDGDHLAMVSEGYIHAMGGDRRFGWRDIAVSIRRLTETRCDAEQLAGALGRLVGSWKLEAGSWKAPQRKPQDETTSPVSSFQYPVSVLALFVRPMRTATVWSGPPRSRAVERDMLNRLLSEEDMKIICGDTTAEIAARLLGAELVMAPPPEEGWAEVPPVSRMVGPDGREPVALVTEGVVTMNVARGRLAEAKRPRDLAGREDGASRLARLLLTADKVRFLVGLAVNPAQTERNGTPLRKAAVEQLVDDLNKRGKIVLVEHF
ncbi:MAG: hypothetical protein NT169_00370 [Chloroflexi bacterium]|nr:hypothetical protein [Chloroflexota bacterium]